MEMELFYGVVLKGNPIKSGNGQPDAWFCSSPQSWNKTKGLAQKKNEDFIPFLLYCK